MIQKEIGKEYSNINERVTFLKDNCDAIESKGYMRQFKPDEIQGYKEKLSELSITIEEKENEKKAAAKRFKTELDPLLNERSETISKIRNKAEYVSELCYKFIEREERQTTWYNSNGDLIELRPSTADELQQIPFVLQKTVVNY